jgi:phosphatidylserine synthase
MPMNGSPGACFHPSNLLTYASLCSAVAAVAAAAHGTAAGAGALITVAVIADTFDGAFARRFSRTPDQRAFGAHLDSLSDAAAFGLAPAACTAVLLGPAPSPLVALAWWTGASACAVCTVTRLGFYHLPATGAAAFVGVPAPVGALLWSSALLLRPGWLGSAAIFAGIGVAMVSPARIRRPEGAGLAAFVAWPLTVLAAHAAALVG